MQIYNQFIINIAFVLILILLCKMGLTQLKKYKIGTADLIKVKSLHHIGQKEKLILVEVEGKNYLVGATQHSVQLISEIDIKNENSLAHLNFSKNKMNNISEA